MSEKRFEIKADDVDSSIINITRDGEDFAWFLSDDITDKQVEKVCDLLNEQSERIKSLEIELDLIANTKLFSRRKLEEENERLKNKLNKGL